MSLVVEAERLNCITHLKNRKKSGSITDYLIQIYEIVKSEKLI